ncbi:hypothetical protein HF324_31895 [Chitinophaga oryzae]|uniref:Uncharacterized protein n=1 Tax=Chitinophaga oryzae TaxID=2725414 RepID=A0AAE7DAU7_9BACT|nr:hypothetical protein [Chitinophaga oryzae]QJB35657.1 hypothetical protein HF329_31900 [Chitinophaga oryzae]QJB42195.1 hypothetical protein HF324_31895 [Chitinophaga oryzae]
MNEEKLVQEEINQIKDKTTELYSYLKNLYYSNRIKNIAVIEKALASYLNDKRSDIKRIAIYGLLFGLKIRHEKYRSIALRFINDPNGDLDLRLFSLSGLSQAYMGTSDVELLKLFYSLYNHDEDDSIRATCFAGMLRILGLSTVEITRINGSVIIIEDDIQTEVFARQLGEIRAIISA